ncbi:hypothetical protein SLA2020_144430 [Shorea laevis]
MVPNRILAWICQGLEEDSMISKFKKCCSLSKLGIIFLFETKRTIIEMNLICIDLGFAHCFAVDCLVGDGLALLWIDGFQLQLSFVSQSPIDVEIVDPGGHHQRLTEFYD